MSSAVLSACGLHRFRLGRDVATTGRVICFVGVNPSIADAAVNDHTVTKLMQFTRLWGGRRLLVGNLFSLRATNVKELDAWQYDEEIGRTNRVNLLAMFAESDVLVPMWGDRNKLPVRMRGSCAFLLATMLMSGKPVGHLGLTKGGDPKHPLMLPYTTPLTFYKGTV